MDEAEEPDVTPEHRRPICSDCMGQGVQRQARAMLLREPDGRSEVVSTLVPAKCSACRGTGKAGA